MDRFLSAARHGDILGDIPSIRQLYEQGSASVAEADRDGMIALALAAYVGRDRIVESVKHGHVISLGKDDHGRLRRLSQTRDRPNGEKVSKNTFHFVKILICWAPLQALQQGFGSFPNIYTRARSSMRDFRHTSSSDAP
jgi:hypothetical protein